MFKDFLKRYFVFFLAILSCYFVCLGFIFFNKEETLGGDEKEVLINQDLKAIKDKIRDAEIIIVSELDSKGASTTKEVVRYLYKTNTNVADVKNEVVEKRGSNYRVINKNGIVEYQFHSGIKYEKEGEVWKKLEWAEEDKKVYDKSLDIGIVSFLKNKLFAGTALADTFFPVTTGDNSEYVSGSVWATVRSATSGTARNGNTCYLQNYKSAGTIYIERAQLVFDTSGLADDCTVSVATLSLNGDWTRGAINNHYFNVYSENGDDTTPDTDDYNDCGTTAYSDTGIDNDEWNTAAGRNNVYTLNATGKSAISVSSNSFFCLTGQTYDAANVEPTDNLTDGVGFASVRTISDTDDPLLTITCVVDGVVEERLKANQPQIITF